MLKEEALQVQSVKEWKREVDSMVREVEKKERDYIKIVGKVKTLVPNLDFSESTRLEHEHGDE